MNAQIACLDPSETTLTIRPRQQVKSDVLLFITTNVKLARKRLLRFRAAFLKARPYNCFVVVTFDAAVTSHVQQIDVDGVTMDHYIFGVDAVDTLGYPNKGTARPFKLIPGNSDLITLIFHKFQPEFRHYWFLEDDVEYTGDPAYLFGDLSKRKGDLLATHLAPGYDAWAYAGQSITLDGQEGGIQQHVEHLVRTCGQAQQHGGDREVGAEVGHERLGAMLAGRSRRRRVQAFLRLR